MSKEERMTPKERMLTWLLLRLAKPDWAQIISRLPQEGVYICPREHEIGDLVICQTSGRFDLHPYIVGYVVKMRGSSDCLIRELGGERTCWVTNETFYAICGLKNEYELLPQAQYKFYQKVRKAFKRGGDWTHLFNDLVFNDDNTVTISVRDRFNGIHRMVNGNRCGSLPYSFTMKWNNKTTIKEILEKLRENGYGEREFETVLHKIGE